MAVIDKIPSGLYRLGYYYSNEFYFSESYQSLTKSGRDLLHCLIGELRWVSFKRGGKTMNEFTNNGKVSFTATQYKKLFGRCSATYLKARNELIETGLIQQTIRGGRCRGDMSKYKILFVDGVVTDEQRWRRYPGKNWGKEIPEAKNTLVGKGTRWKKGQTGRKIKPTLSKYSLNGVNPPKKVDPFEK